MVTVMKSENAGQTRLLGERLGQLLQGGECLEFVSDIGGGKTTFIQGLAAGMGCTENVSSPTFTVEKRYTVGTHTLYHYDFYRLPDPGVVGEELKEALADTTGVVVVEWGGTVEHVLPAERGIIELRRTAESADSRELLVTLPPSYGRLAEALQA